MSFLSLKNIGKIYVNEGNVSVGIRGVNLDFDKGEFVAITGESGSGKSTLLNVLGGIDSYEEGELLIEGEPTSHYIQSDFEEYRKNYISFIFQDYNIIESFTVLENVELALMHIENKIERHKKALELINRVGLSPWIKHKGSKLSGGQKQRTVIARALAKDSPIILADEPTGNLDAATSKEIISLLKEVSADKLLIVVTHNFDEVEDFATRHIRVFNGRIMSDHKIIDGECSGLESTHQPTIYNTSKYKRFTKVNFGIIKNGFSLGKAIFKSTPILTSFTVLLMFICSMGLILVTSFFSDAFNIFDKYNLFNDTQGRVVFVLRESKSLSDEEVEQISKEYGAVDYIKNDAILDYDIDIYFSKIEKSITFNLEYYNNSFKPKYGRLPQNPDEIMLYIPIGLKTVFGDDTNKSMKLNQTSFKVVGISYFYDNTKPAKIITTKEGFDFISYLFYYDPSELMINVNYKCKDFQKSKIFKGFIVDFALEGKTMTIPSNNVSNDEIIETTAFIQMMLKDSLINSEYYYIPVIAYEQINNDQIEIDYQNASDIPSISTELFIEIVKNNVLKDDKQASLFFEDSKIENSAIEKMNDAGFVAVRSDETYTPDALTVVTDSIVIFFNGLLWVIIVLFLSFFIALCLSRSVGTFRGDLPIMRSMGIPEKVIKIGVYTKIFISFVFGLIPTTILTIVIFTSPKYNVLFSFLSPLQYVLIFLGMFFVSFKITRNQIKKLFNSSVKNALKGGNQ